MLAGELPWDCAEDSCTDYRRWKIGTYTRTTPWSKVDTLSLALLRRVLAHLPSARYTIQQIRAHRWFNTDYSGGQLPQEVRKKLRVAAQEVDENAGSLSQTESIRNCRKDEVDNHIEEEWKLFFSQPVRLDDMLVSTQLLNTQSTSALNCMEKLVRRMTRFFVNLTVQEALDELTAMLDKLTLSWKITTIHIVTINTVDKRKNQLIFKCNVLDTDTGTLMDFRLSRGCGLEFKRQFVLIRSALREVIVPS
ncbi:hypothetical protein O3M35_007288 [Rhynocoris fuscipes]|uniref:Uncharacterized protein n=1 Tax=Rhynocoris fuscipes TaxID=488301 RepID=A0AAW1DGC4_9HEMI